MIPGNDDAMRAIELYAGGIADAVLEGRSTLPEVAVGEDEFVELDEEGKPRAKAGPKRRAAPARKKTPVRRKPAAAEAEAAHDAVAELAEADPEESPEAFMARREAARKKAPAAPAGGAAPPPCRCRRRGPGRGRVIMAVTAEAVKALRERTGAGMMECKKALVESNGDLEVAAEAMRKSGPRQGRQEGRPRRRRGRGRHRARRGRQVGRAGRGQFGDGLRRAREGLPGLRGRRSRAPHSRRSQRTSTALLAAKLPSGQTVEETRRALIARIGENISVRRFEVVTAGASLATYVHGSRIGTVVVLEGGDAALGHDLAMHVAAINPQYLAAEDVPAEQVEKEREIFVAQAATDPKLAGKPKEVLVKASEGKLRKYLGEITLLGQPFVKDDKQAVGEVLKRANARVAALRALRSRRRHREEAGRLRRRGDGPGPGSLSPDRSRRRTGTPRERGSL